eukprot:4359603-Amphidinium_carterae.1
MTQGFTTLVRGVMEDNPTFKLIRCFNTVEALLTEFHSSKGYTTVLAPLIDLTTKKPRANGADGNGDKSKDSQKGKKGDGKDGREGKGGKDGKGSKNDGKDNKKSPTKDGKPQASGPPQG